MSRSRAGISRPTRSAGMFTGPPAPRGPNGTPGGMATRASPPSRRSGSLARAAAARRLQSGGLSGYVGLYNWSNGSPVRQLCKRSGGSWTQLGSPYSSGALAAGTQLKVIAVGSTIAFLVNGVQRIGVSDSSFTGGGPGIVAYGNATAGNWAGGNAAFYSVGGTVSGLSGTVVLQDNGGDDLSVSGNGTFTFNTPLATGGAYSVTVKTNPAGQSCTVSNGSGTVASANITNVAVSCRNIAAYSVCGNVHRPSGAPGPQRHARWDGHQGVAPQPPLGLARARRGGAASSVGRAERLRRPV